MRSVNKCLDIGLLIYEEIVVNKLSRSKKYYVEKLFVCEKTIRNYISRINCYLADNFRSCEIINVKGCYKLVNY